MTLLFRLLALALVLALPAPPAIAQSLQDILQRHQAEVAKPGRRSVGVVIEDLVASGLPEVPDFLTAWAGREAIRIRQASRAGSTFETIRPVASVT